MRQAFSLAARTLGPAGEKARLKGDFKDWTLVATSCVEAGVDFSFRTAFRESCGLLNLLQIAGRLSRSAEYAEAEVWEEEAKQAAAFMRR